jgi:hypothetical protein
MLQDIWNPENKRWITSEDLLSKLKSKRNWIAEYSTIKSKIPKSWNNTLLQNEVLKRKSDIIFQENTLMLYNLNTRTLLDSRRLKQKQVVKLLQIDTGTKSKGEIKWNQYCPADITWNKICEYKNEGLSPQGQTTALENST